MKIARIFTATLLLVLSQGCEKPSKPAPQDHVNEVKTVASISPAGVDIVIGLGHGGVLKGVSNWEPPSALTQPLPRVGDYRTIDWEKLQQIQPKLLITQYADGKMPPGLSEKATAGGMTVVNIQIERLDDIRKAIIQISDHIDDGSATVLTLALLDKQLDDVRATMKGKPRPRTLLMIGESSLASAAPGTFLDDLLDVAGGVNVIPKGTNLYPSIDREQLVSLDPEVVIYLLPGASEQVLKAARENWERQPAVKATREGRVYFLTEPTLLLPGFCIGKTAVTLNACIAPKSAATKGTP